MNLGQPCAGGHQPDLAQPGEDRGCGTLRQADVVARQQLRRLRDEFEIDKPAGHELEIKGMARRPLLGHQLAHGDDVGDCLGAVARPPQHLGDGAVHRGVEVGIRLDEAGAGERQMLPGPGVLFLVKAEGAQARRQGTRIAGGPKPHVGVIEHAFRGRRGYRRDEPLGEAREILRRGQRPFAI